MNAITVKGLSKKYRIGLGLQRRDTLFSAIAGFFGGGKAELNGAAREDEIWALQDVSFEVKHGEAVGVIGRNGAGKTTLLSILSRITEPTAGRAELAGRVASLIAVGTGFHPELTGRENIFLNGAVLGMRRAEMKRKFDEIVAFSEIEKFIDTPVKRYSSGMYVRLAFAVAAHLDPEILLVDEVLAVGDVAFQKKCLGKMGEVAGSGRTVMFVSHNMRIIRNLCGRAMLLDGGRLVAYDETLKITKRYLAEFSPAGSMSGDFKQPEGAKHFMTRAAIAPLAEETERPLFAGEPWRARVWFTLLEPLKHCIVGVGVKTSEGEAVHVFWSEPADLEAGGYKVEFVYESVMLSAGTYNITLGLSTYERTVHSITDAASFDISDAPDAGKEFVRTSGTGLLLNKVMSTLTREGG